MEFVKGKRTPKTNMKRKLSSVIAIGLAVVSADARNHIRGAHPERDGRKRSNADGPHAKPSQSFEQIRRMQTQTAAEQHHLCIYSEFAKGVQCEQLWRDRGHAALMLISQFADDTPPQIDTWGLWPDLNDDIIDAGLSNVLGGSDVRHNFFRDAWTIESYPYVHCRQMNPAQTARLSKTIEMESARWAGWTPWNNCASFVEAVFEDVMETVVVPTKPWWHVGVETPCELGGHIRRLNGGRDLPAGGVPI